MASPLIVAFLLLGTAPDNEPDFLFSKHQSLGGVIDTVEVWLQGVRKDGEVAPPHFVVRRTVSYKPELKLPAKWRAQKTVLWANDATCPQGQERWHLLTTLPMPTIKIAEVPSGDLYAIHAKADGAVYRVVAPGYYPAEPGKIDVIFGSDTPVAEWIDETYRVFAPCWQTAKP